MFFLSVCRYLYNPTQILLVSLLLYYPLHALLHSFHPILPEQRVESKSRRVIVGQAMRWYDKTAG